MTALPPRPSTPGPHRPRTSTRWLTLRDVLFTGQGRGALMPDDRAVEAESALVFSVGTETLVLQGSLRRLLRTLEFLRRQLLADATEELEAVVEVPEDDPGVGPLAGLRCPYCGYVTFTGDGAGIRVVQRDERTSVAGYEAGRGIVGVQAEYPDRMEDRYECEECDRPVHLPENLAVRLDPGSDL